MGILAPKVPAATQPQPLKVAPRSTVDPQTGAGATRARERAAVAARAAGKSRFRVDVSPDIQTPASRGGLRIPGTRAS